MKENIDDKRQAPRKPKTYVLDTTVLIDDPNLMYRLGSHIIVIPFVVLKEIDGLKKSEDPNTAKAAREVARILDRISSCADLAKGVKLSTGGVLALTDKYDDFDGLASEADNRIVGTALMLKRNGENVELLTTDGNMRTAVRLKGAKGDVPLVGDGFRMEDEKYLDNMNLVVRNNNSLKPNKFFSKKNLLRIFLKLSVLIAIIGIIGIFILEKKFAKVLPPIIGGALMIGIVIMWFLADKKDLEAIAGFGPEYNAISHPAYLDLKDNIWHNKTNDKD